MKTQIKTVETSIPFPGFYHSFYDHEMDNEIERDSEHFAEQWKLETRQVANEIYSHVDCSEAQVEVCKLHCQKWLEKWTEETGIEIANYEFKAMQSPKEYNFATDRVFVGIPFEVVEKAFAQCEADKFLTLDDLIQDRFTSRSGFMSFYSNDTSEWLAKPLANWDHNEVETLLLATLALHTKAEDFQEAVEMDVLDYGGGNGVFTPEYDMEALKAALGVKE